MRTPWLILASLLVVTGATAAGQDTLPPSQGGYVHSLGLPGIYKAYLGVGFGLSHDRGDHLATQLRAGVFRPLMNPITELLGWSAETYFGVRDVRTDYGARAYFLSHLFGVGVGVDYSLRSGRGSPLLTLVNPGRRGGIIGGGSDLRLEVLPGRHHLINLAVTIPIDQPHRGRTRPTRDYVRIEVEDPPRPGFDPDSALRTVLAAVRDHALWIDRLTVPDLGGLSADPGAAATAAVAELKSHLANHSVASEVVDYHRELLRAFSMAAIGMSLPEGGMTPSGIAATESAKQILLERVLLPYNQLLGQAKRDDTTREFGVHARGLFARWLMMNSAVSPDRNEACLYVFQRLLDIVEEIRAANHRTWGNSRLVWLPLQLSLVPEEHNDQEEIDSIISHAVGHAVTHGNKISYMENSQFNKALVESIGLAEEYHLLWIHDFSALNDQRQPDRYSLLTVVREYLSALRDHVARYDSTGRLPVYMIFHDQHFFEKHKSRDLLHFLQDPLARNPNLPPGPDSLAQKLAVAQRQLRDAVASSRLLQAERAQYGDRWLHRLISVHVSVTHPVDPSFRSRQILPLIGIPDDVMRDHRKAVLYDVSEDDPYRGMAMYGGMGVGEHYTGPAWEDRAMTLQGPVALTLRDEARALLESQGIRGGEVPQVLRARPKGPHYDELVKRCIDSMDVSGGSATRAIQLQNETGAGLKEISVAEATLINLMSPGGVVKIPDSIWLNQFLASLLVGAGLRGVRVLVIAPAEASAPGKGPTLWMIHDLMSRLVALQSTLAPEYARSGGFVRVGLYNPKAGVDNLRARVIALRNNLDSTPFLRTLYSFQPPVFDLLEHADTLPTGLPPSSPDSIVRPLLHLKGYLYISGPEWERLISGLPMAYGLAEFLVQRAKQIAGEWPSDSTDVAMQRLAWIINLVLDSLPDSERACPRPQHCPGRHWVSFLQVGSPNQDYRSMAMDGEAATLVSRWTALYGVPDFVLITGLSSWPENQAALDELLPPPDDRLLGFLWWIHMVL
jgi:hypothetical protein